MKGFDIEKGDHTMKIIKIDGYIFTLGYSGDGEIQISSSKGLSIKSQGDHALFIQLNRNTQSQSGKGDKN